MKRLVCPVFTLVLGVLTFAFPSLSTLSPVLAFAWLQTFLLVLLMPGMLFSIAISGNIHVFRFWIAAIGNFLFYLAATSVLARL